MYSSVVHVVHRAERDVVVGVGLAVGPVAVGDSSNCAIIFGKTTPPTRAMFQPGFDRCGDTALVVHHLFADDRLHDEIATEPHPFARERQPRPSPAR